MNLKFSSFKKNTFYWIVLAGCLIVVVGYLGNQWYLSGTGYCFEQKRYLSDAEFVQIAVNANMEKIDIDGSEESILNYQKKNPQCCSINREPRGESLLNVMFNHAYVDVTLRYKKKKGDPSSKEEPFYQAFVSIHSCGKVLDTTGSGSKTIDGPF